MVIWDVCEHGNAVGACVYCLQLQVASQQEEIRRLTKDLALNAAMLAKQCDLARQAETERDEARAEVKVWHQKYHQVSAWADAHCQ